MVGPESIPQFDWQDQEITSTPPAFGLSPPPPGKCKDKHKHKHLHPPPYSPTPSLLPPPQTKCPNCPMVTVTPDELTFEFELEKPCYCDMKVANNSEHHVAFKVKTTSPKKYFVRPNTGIVQPWDSCVITVTLQPQKECLPDLQCRDKFLLQSTKVPQVTDIDEVPADAFNKDGGRVIEEFKLRVVYILPGQSIHGDHEHWNPRRTAENMTIIGTATIADVHVVQRLKEERDVVFQQNSHLQREIEMLKRRRSRKGEARFSFKFAAFVGIVAATLGFILNLIFSSHSTSM